MTVQPTRDQLRAHLRRLIAAWEGPGNPSVPVADLAHLLDQLDAAERRADEARAERDHFHEVAATFRDKFNAAEARIKAESRIAEEKHLRMKATAAATKAEARFQAVEDVLAAWHVEPGESGLADDLLRALNT